MYGEFYSILLYATRNAQQIKVPDEIEVSGVFRPEPPGLRTEVGTRALSP